jgi:peptide/nickel transport system ATP-binding protein
MNATHNRTDGRPPLLRVENLVKTFSVGSGGFGKQHRIRAVSDVSFEVHRGQTLSLVGESGCGKSTVARLVTGLHRPDSGRVYVDGTNLTAVSRRSQLKPFGRRLQMVFQDPFASLNPRWRVGRIISEPIRAFGLADTRAEVDARLFSLLREVGLAAEDAGKFPHEFSGGQRQRISIARALASEPELLVCDEPTSALDVSVQAQILNLLKDLQDRLDLALLFISHNLAVVHHLSDYVGVMYLGRLVELGASNSVFARPAHPYTRLLLNTIPDLEMSGRARPPITGEVPDPIDPPPGCVFHPRCPAAREVCEVASPLLAGQERGSAAACHAATQGWNTEEAAPERARLEAASHAV